MISEENAPPIGAPPTEVNGFEHATNITRVEDHPLKRCSKVDERIITEKDAQTKRCEGEYSPPRVRVQRSRPRNLDFDRVFKNQILLRSISDVAARG